VAAPLESAPTMIEIPRTAALAERVDQEIAVSSWLPIGQERIDRFAENTDDRQWIHLDADRAAAESPYGATIAHGFLVLSLVSAMARDAMRFSNLRLAINYGLNRVRFVSPVPAGARVRGRFTPIAVAPLDGGGVQVTWRVAVEREGGEKPACVAEWLVRYHETESAG